MRKLKFLLDRVHRGLPIDDPLKPRLSCLVESGVLERISRGRGVRYILSSRFYAMTGQKGIYTRKVCLDKETNKALLLKHIRSSKTEGAKMQELQQVLPALSRQQIQRLLFEMADEGYIHLVGIKRAAKWHSVGGD